jgi:hypothetical protein
MSAVFDWLTKHVRKDGSPEIARVNTFDMNGRRYSGASQGTYLVAVETPDAPLTPGGFPSFEATVAAAANRLASTSWTMPLAGLKAFAGEPVAPEEFTTCPHCNGSGHVECDNCDGTGTIHCDSWDCPGHYCCQCGGSGKEVCDCEKGKRWVAPKPVPCQVGELTIDRNLLSFALEHLEGVTVRLCDAEHTQSLALGGDGWIVVVMLLRWDRSEIPEEARLTRDA